MRLILTSFIIIFYTHAYGASCCGGGASATSIMTGDTKWLFKTGYSDVTLLGDSSNSSDIEFRNADSIETIRTTNFEYTYLLSSLWQLGVSVPIVEKIRQLGDERKSNSGVGDLKFVLGHEFMPLYGRSVWPRGYLYTGISLPTAPSLFTSKRRDLLDTRGTGHYHYLLGTYFEKRLSNAVLTFQPQLSYRAGRKFSDDNLTQEKIETEDSLDHLVTFSAATDVLELFTTSIFITRNYAEKKAISNFIGSSRPSLVHDVGLGINYAIQKGSNIGLTYTDQFLYRDSYNHTLGRSLGLSYNLVGSL